MATQKGFFISDARNAIVTDDYRNEILTEYAIGPTRTGQKDPAEGGKTTASSGHERSRRRV